MFVPELYKARKGSKSTVALLEIRHLYSLYVWVGISGALNCGIVLRRSHVCVREHRGWLNFDRWRTRDVQQADFHSSNHFEYSPKHGV